MKKPRNYINNRTLYEALVKHRELLAFSKIQEKEKPRTSNYIGEAIYLICNNLAKKPNFSGYTYRQEMIDDALIDCVAAVDNFDPNKTQNPFAYFTQIAWNAFVRRIFKEKKQTYIKHKNYEYMSVIFGSEFTEENNTFKRDENTDEMIKNFERALTKEKKPVNIGVEKFVESREVSPLNIESEENVK